MVQLFNQLLVLKKDRVDSAIVLGNVIGILISTAGFGCDQVDEDLYIGLHWCGSWYMALPPTPTESRSGWLCPLTTE